MKRADMRISESASTGVLSIAKVVAVSTKLIILHGKPSKVTTVDIKGRSWTGTVCSYCTPLAKYEISVGWQLKEER